MALTASVGEPNHREAVWDRTSDQEDSTVMTFPKMTKRLSVGLLAATLTLGGGAAAVSASQASAAAAPNPTRQAACQDYQNKFAQNLGVTVQKVQDARKATENQIIDARLAAGQITAEQAQKAHARVNASTGSCTASGQAGTAVHHAAKEFRQVELKAVAQKLGVSEQDLVKELRTGKSLAQVAQAHNVGRDDLKATMRTALQTDLTARVQAKKLTQAQADKALAAFDKHVDKLIDRVWK